MYKRQSPSSPRPPPLTRNFVEETASPNRARARPHPPSSTRPRSIVRRRAPFPDYVHPRRPVAFSPRARRPSILIRVHRDRSRPRASFARSRARRIVGRVAQSRRDAGRARTQRTVGEWARMIESGARAAPQTESRARGDRGGEIKVRATHRRRRIRATRVDVDEEGSARSFDWNWHSIATV